MEDILAEAELDRLKEEHFYMHLEMNKWNVKYLFLQFAVRDFLEAYNTGPSVMESPLIQRLEELVK